MVGFKYIQRRCQVEWPARFQDSSICDQLATGSGKSSFILVVRNCCLYIHGMMHVAIHPYGRAKCHYLTNRAYSRTTYDIVCDHPVCTTLDCRLRNMQSSSLLKVVHTVLAKRLNRTQSERF